MRPQLELGELKQVRFWEYALRFLVGGAITGITGLVAHAWGPAVGGLFLAFPCILPASLTLVKQHDGRARAVEDARGGRLGSVGLAVFGALVAWLAPHASPWLVLSAATVAWLVVDVALWQVTLGRKG
ncbi:MAG TPA: DUF3147 family protein [Polyangiaceae bacterium]|jgi:hypothetical protein